MNKELILSKVDHTLLSPSATQKEVASVCHDSILYKTASACIPPYYVKEMKNVFGKELTITTVVGFPLGYSVTEVKLCEAEKAISDGAEEIDMVVNISEIKNKNFDKVREEIKMIKKMLGNITLKVIIETSYLTENEKIKLCQIINESGADFIKTSTGFTDLGAQIEDIHLFKKYLDPSIKIKASGGIRTRNDFEDFLLAGTDRIGTSSAINILTKKIEQCDSY